MAKACSMPFRSFARTSTDREGLGLVPTVHASLFRDYTIRYEVWRPALEAAGLLGADEKMGKVGLGPHVLRHTWITHRSHRADLFYSEVRLDGVPAAMCASLVEGTTLFGSKVAFYRKVYRYPTSLRPRATVHRTPHCGCTRTLCAARTGTACASIWRLCCRDK